MGIWILIRHPEVAVPHGVCYGRLDVALAAQVDLGRIVDALAGISAFTMWSSPARRCVAVAEAIAVRRGVPFHTDARLLELDFGAWEGRAWDDVPRDALDCWAADPLDFAPPGGESGASLVRRVTAFHAEIGRDAGTVMVISHGGPLRVLGALVRGATVNLLAPSPALGSVQIIDATQSAAHSAITAVAPSTSPV